MICSFKMLKLFFFFFLNILFIDHVSFKNIKKIFSFISMVLRVKNFLNLKKKKKGLGGKVKEKRKFFSSREKKNYKNIVTF